VTRLTSEDLADTPDVSRLDMKLNKAIGADTYGIACGAVKATGGIVRTDGVSTAVVPITSGDGVIGGFSESVCAIVRSMGMNGFVTEGHDVTGFAEAIASGAEIVFMADDYQFVAYNVRTGAYADNTESTAMGYVSALRIAEGCLEGKDVLVLGAGRVGTVAVGILAAECREVRVFDIDNSRARELAGRYPNVRAVEDAETAIGSNMLILNASPAPIPGEWIADGSVISSPGVPYAFDALGEKRARVIIHDPLSIGVATMAALSSGRIHQEPIHVHAESSIDERTETA
jgi:3-methylornithyl-N6-L-lysine dehydrogenase